MADVVEDVERLLGLPDDQHWLCPRNGHDVAGRYFDEDVYDELAAESQTSKKARLSKVKEAEARKIILLNALRIFAFDGADAIRLQKQLLRHLSNQLSDCDVCVRIYHKSRSELKDQLEQQFEEEDVANFMTMFDDINIKRIREGLHKAQVRLESLPVSQRSVKALDMESTYALFEALSCKVFICNEQLLAEHFDPPFQMVQVNKRLILQAYLPATTHFLFSSNSDRRKWAVATWGKLRRPPTLVEFDWAIKEPLLAAIGRVQMHSMEPGFTPKFWGGFQLIISKLNKDLITHAIRGLEYDVYKLVLDHLQVDPVAFLDVVRTLSTLITLSPSDFWDSMGTISPTTIVEQIFGSPVMEYILMNAAGDDNVKGSIGHSEVLAWIVPFIASIKASSNRIPACRTLVQHLMDKCQAEKFPQVAKTACFSTGLEVLCLTLQSLNVGKTDATFVGNASVYDILSLVAQYLDPILELAKHLENKDVPEDTIPLPLQVIQKALALDCLALTVRHRKVFEKRKLEPDKDTNAAPLWQKVIEQTRSGAQALATHALLGALDLTGLEKFVQNRESPLTKDRVEWNFAFQTRSEYVTSILDRISNFEGYAIAGMFKSYYLARAIVAPLLSSNEDTRQAAVAVYKAIALEDGRREAIRYILEQPYERFLRALADVIQILASKKPYRPMTALIRLSSDIHESLCNSQNGILRAKNLTNPECDATKIYWRATWRALSTIFKSTEMWSYQGHDKTEIMDFCKDTMQFVDGFFDSYDIFVNALAVIDDQSEKDNSGEVASQLLSIPRDAMEFITVWLRFRDEYLADKIVKLVSKLLVKLRDIKQECDENTLDYLKRVILGDVKTKLTPQQCAQLERAWEIHTRRRIPRPEQKQAAAAKQASLNQWIAADKQKQRQLEMKDVLADSTRAAQLYKERMLSKTATTSTPKETQRPLLDTAAIKKRKEEAEARKRADANRARALRGEVPKTVLETKEKQQKGDGVMVSSDEESDGERETRIDELLGFSSDTKEQKSSTSHIFANIPAPAPRPVKVSRIVRSAKDMRARLAPDLSPLHKEILSWDFFYNGEFPPGSDPDHYKAVPKKFRNVLEYKDVFRPLLTLEAWQSIVKTRAELSSKPYDATVVTRTTVNAFIEISTTIAHSDDPDQRPSEGDIVLFSTSNTPHLSEKQPHCLARVLEVKRKKQHLEVLYRAMPSPSNPQFGAKSVVYAVKIQSITPLEREFGALVGLEYYDLAEFILSARPSHLLQYTDMQLDPISKNYELNKAQAKAVKSALDNDAFTLVQGPPGSGKTKTIVAIVGALLSDSFRDQGTAVRDPMGKSASSRPAKKLLVCAPSNAAVDELVMRFKQGIRTMSGYNHKINVVRLGRSDAINTQVLDVTLDELVNERLSLNGAKENARAETQKITKEHQEVSEKLRLAREKENSETVKNANDMNELLSEIQALARRKKELGNMRDAALDKEQGEHRAAELARKQARQAILDSAHVICATLSGSGHEMFQNLNLEFETVVVDEAAQCVEMSALIPLKYGCAKCILVGDPKQLPPTVFSREAQRFQYEQSLFQRMQLNDSKAVHMLDTQYRMHPEISLFPSGAFYDKRLLDGPDMGTLRRRPWHANDLFGPYVFFNVAGKHQTAGSSKSLINRAEIEIADALYSRLNLDHKKLYDFKGKIGIITPYKGQLNELKSHFRRRYGPEITNVVEFNTTDAFQGRESEVIIFSCVRAQDEGSVGFLQDIRRMNVGLTRAKSSLWVLGNAETLMRGEYWRKLIEDAKARDRFLTEDRYMGPLKDPRGSMPLKLRPAEPKDVVMMDAPAPVPSVALTAPMAQMMPSNNIASNNDARPQTIYTREFENGRTPPRMTIDGTSSNRGSSVDSARSSDSRDPRKGKPPVKKRSMPMDNNPLLSKKKPRKD